jgi:glycosyltransferase involved in cell wall biosynthesis
LKILLIHQYFLEPNDAGGSRFNEMTSQWSSNENEITVLAGMMHANGKEKIAEYKGKRFVTKMHDDVKVIRCHVSESYNNGFLGRLWGYFSFVFSSIWAGLFKAKGKYDVILVTSPPLFVGITAYILSLFKRTPFVFEVRDLWPESAIDTGVVTNKWIIKFSYWFEAFIYKRAKLINVLTPAFRDKLIQNKNVPADKIIFIPNAADFSLSEQVMKSDFSPQAFRKELGWENKVVITYVGAHGVANHLIQAIDTAELIKDALPQVHFVMIGGGMEKDKLIEEVKKRGLRNVEFIDSVPKIEVFKYIMASDFGASILKKVDTFKTIYSNKTFDYMSCKKPIMLAIDGVSRDLVEKADCGFFLEPENPEDWAEKFEKILKLSPERLKQMGANGYEHARVYFDRTELANDYIELIRSKLNLR